MVRGCTPTQPPKWLERLLLEEPMGDRVLAALSGEDLPVSVLADLLDAERGPSVQALAAAADWLARSLYSGRGTFIRNIYVAYSNVCITACPFCSFYRPPGHPEAYRVEPRDVEALVAKYADRIREVHMTGGNDPEVTLDYLKSLVAAARRAAPHATVKAFTAEEIWFYSKLWGESSRRILEELRSAGVEMLPGGGAEVLSPLRSKLAPRKGSVEDYARIHMEAHDLGMWSNITLLYGHVEEPVDVATHLDWVRRIADYRGRVASLVLVRWNPGSTPLARSEWFRRRAGRGGDWDLRVTAVSRLALAHRRVRVAAYWVSTGLDLAEAMLTAGASDLTGTFHGEPVIQAARGGGRSRGVEASELAWRLRVANWEPWERSSWGEPIAEWRQPPPPWSPRGVGEDEEG